MNIKTNLKHIGTTLFVLCLPAVLFVVILLSSNDNVDGRSWSSAASKSAFYFGLVFLVTIPGLLLHYNYYKQDRKKRLRLKEDHFELYKCDEVFKINFADIQKVEIHCLAWSNRNPWNNYGYTKIYMQNGSTFLFTSLLLDLISSKTYFASINIDVETIEDFYTWVK